MANEIKTILNRFDRGMVNDKRTPLENACRVVSNFDILTTPFKLRPYRDNEDGDAGSSTSQKQNFAVGAHPSSGYALYGLGITGSNNPEVLYKDLATGVDTSDLDDSGWDNTANNSGSNTLMPELFVFYEKTGKFYGAQSSDQIWSYSPTGPTWVNDAYPAVATFSATDINCNGLVHSKDDILYIPIGNVIYKNNNDSWSSPLSLPSHFKITSIAEYGNFLAIACAPKTNQGRSRIYLWDRGDNPATLSESIDCEGLVQVLDVVDGLLVAISKSGNNSFNDKVIFSYYNNKPETEKIMELFADTSTTIQLKTAKQHINNRLYFMLHITLDGVIRSGVWSFGRSSTGQSLALTHEREIATDYDANDTLLNFIIVGDYVFQAYTDSSTYKVVKTNNATSYTLPSVYETVINPGVALPDRQIKKQLNFVAVKYEALPSAGQVILKYKVDGDTSWTTIFTETTNGATVTEKQITAKIGRDYQFRLESTGGAVITSFKAVYSRLETLVP